MLSMDYARTSNESQKNQTIMGILEFIECQANCRSPNPKKSWCFFSFPSFPQISCFSGVFSGSPDPQKIFEIPPNFSFPSFPQISCVSGTFLRKPQSQKNRPVFSRSRASPKLVVFQDFSPEAPIPKNLEIPPNFPFLCFPKITPISGQFLGSPDPKKFSRSPQISRSRASIKSPLFQGLFSGSPDRKKFSRSPQISRSRASIKLVVFQDFSPEAPISKNFRDPPKFPVPMLR